MIWYSLSVSVCAGATVIESPVWTPIGSRFSIEQTMMQLSLRSRTTSISNSFQPISDSSISSSLRRRGFEAALADVDELFLVVGDAAARTAHRERRPDDRREAEHGLHLLCLFHAEWAMPNAPSRDRSWSSPSLNFSTVFGLVDGFLGVAPIISTFVLIQHAVLGADRVRSSSAVCPPIVGSSASGRSFSMIFSTTFQVIGSM